MIHAYLMKQEKSQINNLTVYLKELGKEEQMNSQVGTRKEIKIREEINYIDTKKAIDKGDEIKSWFFKNKHK